MKAVCINMTGLHKSKKRTNSLKGKQFLTKLTFIFGPTKLIVSLKIRCIPLRGVEEWKYTLHAFLILAYFFGISKVLIIVELRACRL